MKRLKEIVRKLNQAKVLVIGDLILDEYISGNVDRVSPEAPVPVVWANKHSYMPGGAANVANNIAAFDARASLLGVIGRDKSSETLRHELKKRKISSTAIFSESGRHTTVKTRIIAGHQQVVRVDWEDTHALAKEANLKIINYIGKNITKFDAVIIEDYGKGVINPHLLAEVVALCRKHKKVITVDPKEENFIYYRGVTAMTPNRKELENGVRNLRIKDTTNKFRVHNDRLFNDQEINAAATQILKYLNLDSILVTLGEQGMRLFEKNGRLINIPTVAQEVFDVSGAGDTVIAVFTLALAVGASLSEAAYIANYAAGIVVGKLGTATTDRKELIQRMGTATFCLTKPSKKSLSPHK